MNTHSPEYHFVGQRLLKGDEVVLEIVGPITPSLRELVERKPLQSPTPTPDPDLIAVIAHLVSVMTAYEPFFAAVVPRPQFNAAIALGTAHVKGAARAGLKRADYVAALERVDRAAKILEGVPH